jgi:hypothetical protein
VKCDAEGAEVDILRGARDFLQRQEAIWMVEVCEETTARFDSAPRELVSVFRTLGREEYLGYRISYPSGDLLPLESGSSAGIFNAVFCPRSLDARLQVFHSRPR